MTAIATSPPILPPPLPRPEGKVLLRNISWNTYQRLLAEAGDGAVRMVFDRGLLEIEVPSTDHEIVKSFIGRLIEIYTLEADVNLVAVGSATWGKEDLDRGLEADECYYLANATAIAGKRNISLENDPPPDLAVEVDLSSSSIDKLAVYAALGIPEVWRYRGGRLQYFALRGGAYVPVERSLSLPDLPAEVIERHVALRDQVQDTAASRAFRDWVRQHAPGPRG